MHLKNVLSANSPLEVAADLEPGLYFAVALARNHYTLVEFRVPDQVPELSFPAAK